jgi:hypothetical protein
MEEIKMRNYLFSIEDYGINFIISTNKEIENCVEKVRDIICQQFSHDVKVSYDRVRGFYINDYTHVYYTEVRIYTV